MGSRTRSRWLAGGLVTVGVAACAVSPAGTTQVEALWFGTGSGGEVVGGATPVGITTEEGPADQSFSVDLTGLRDDGAGDAWNASAWSGSAVAMLSAGLDPAGRTVRFDVSEAIDGPSAGALMAVGVLGDLQGCKLDPAVTVTGAVLPDGGISAVGGVPEKIRAAARAGIERILIPEGNKVSVDPTGGQEVDVIAQGSGLGIEVEPIRSVADAYQRMCPTAAPAAAGAADAMDPALRWIVGKGAERALRNVRTLPVAPYVGSADLWSTDRSRVRRARATADSRVPKHLRQGDVVSAYAVAALAERTILAWNATMLARKAARDRPAAIQQHLVRQAQDLRGHIERWVAEASGTSLTRVEQFAQLPDALSWGTDSLATVLATTEDLAQAELSQDEIGSAAADLAYARYDAARVLPLAVRAVMATGRWPVGGDAAQLLSTVESFAAFLTDAGDANVRYARQLGAGDSDSLPDERLARILRERLRAPTDGSSRQASVMSRATVALSYFVMALNQVSMKGLASAAVGTGQLDLDRVAILDEAVFAERSDVARDRARTLALQFSDLQLDPSYLQWGSTWGRQWAMTPDRWVSQQSRREGLVYQWYAAVQGQIGLALAGTVPPR